GLPGGEPPASGPPGSPPASCPPGQAGWGCEGPAAETSGRVWGEADFLLWWMRGAGLPPLVTTSPPGTAMGQAGRLGAGGPTVLVGGSAVNGDLRTGVRLTLGGWIDGRQSLGAEVSFFVLEHKATRFALGSADGSSILARPFFGAGNQPNA